MKLKIQYLFNVHKYVNVKKKFIYHRLTIVVHLHRRHKVLDHQYHHPIHSSINHRYNNYKIHFLVKILTAAISMWRKSTPQQRIDFKAYFRVFTTSITIYFIFNTQFIISIIDFA